MVSMQSLLRGTATTAVLLLAQIVSASHPTPMSVNTSEFKRSYTMTGIVPQIVAAIDPQCSFYVGYRERDGDRAIVMPGHTLSLFEIQQMPFEFSVEGMQNVTGATRATRYLLYIADVDAPDRNNPTSRNMRYYLGGNFTLNGTSAVLPTAQRLVNLSLPFNEYINPNPMPSTGVHRFLSALYIQPERFNTRGFETAMGNSSRANWNLSEWRTQLGLGPAIAATVWQVNTTDALVFNAAPRALSAWSAAFWATTSAMVLAALTAL